MGMQLYTLLAGTVCKRNGVPFRLAHDTQIECEEGNVDLIAGDQRLDCSQELQFASNPAQAAFLPVMSTTNNSSLESMVVDSQSRTCTGVMDVSTIQVEPKQCQ